MQDESIVIYMFVANRVAIYNIDVLRVEHIFFL